ncbi:MAG: HD domain-containing phosphohydrolase [Pseudomonadota bacterium]|nr:HD domain-containing phosphohydrolase [Pseudomonadota bacterium]
MAHKPQTETGPTYQQIPLSTLAPERQVGIKLFLRTGQDRFVLFLNETSLLSTTKIDQLKQNNVSHLYLNTGDRQGYLNYIKENLSTILSNPNLSENDKASIIYETASDITKELFSQPSTENIEQTRNLVDCMIDTISQSPKTSNLLMMITNQDYYTYTHSINVGIYAISMMRKAMPSIAESDLKTLGLGFFLHDLGKAKIPNSIINKQGPLDQSEWELMQEHPTLGTELASKMGTRNPAIIDIILTHHERCSGSGYPKKLPREKISMPGKICAFCDVFDALTTKRSYKKALSTFEALKIIKDETPEHFDEELVNPFIMLFS